ncbi:MAG: hypothetical protein Q8R07_04720 [Candidatus Uhrbacteria bacterium]|nr:hypothetical protein [Candidatus Uhrbacteria bacterium]
MIIVLIITTLLLIVALVIANIGAEVVEDEHAFLKIVGIFLLIYVVAVIVIVYLFKTHRIPDFQITTPNSATTPESSTNTYGYQ